jgi:hypothetical protein
LFSAATQDRITPVCALYFHSSIMKIPSGYAHALNKSVESKWASTVHHRLRHKLLHVVWGTVTDFSGVLCSIFFSFCMNSWQGYSLPSVWPGHRPDRRLVAGASMRLRSNHPHAEMRPFVGRVRRWLQVAALRHASRRRFSCHCLLFPCCRFQDGKRPQMDLPPKIGRLDRTTVI